MTNKQWAIIALWAVVALAVLLAAMTQKAEEINKGVQLINEHKKEIAMMKEEIQRIKKAYRPIVYVTGKYPFINGSGEEIVITENIERIRKD
ncbi:hypothetical protein ACFL2O_07780 [Thermodesulfobacteriota bacterium]